MQEDDGKIFGNKKRELLFKELVETYGEGKWSDIARNFKIHGITIKRANDLRRIWEKMNPDIRQDGMSEIELENLLLLGMEVRGSRPMMIEQWVKRYGNHRSPEQIVANFKRQMKNALFMIAQVFCRKKTEIKTFISKMLYTTFKKFVKMSDATDLKEPILQNIKDISQIMSKLLVEYARHKDKCRGFIFEVFSSHAKKQQVEAGFEYLKYINYLRLISDKSFLTDNDIRPYLSKCKLLKPSIDANRETVVFRKLFGSSHWNKMHKLYQTALEQKYSYFRGSNDNKNFVYDPFGTTKRSKKSNHSIRMGEEIRQKTVRGRIKQPNIEIFASTYANNFKNDLLKECDQRFICSDDDSVSFCDKTVMKEIQQPDEDKEFDLDDDELEEHHKLMIMEREIESMPDLRRYIEQQMQIARIKAYNDYKSGLSK